MTWRELLVLTVSLVIAWPVTVISWSLPTRFWDRTRLAQATRWKVLIVAALPLILTLWAILLVPSFALLGTLIMGWILICLAVIDARTFVLPDCLTYPLIVLGLVHAVGLNASMNGAAQGVAVGLQHFLAAVLGYVILAAVAGAFRKLRGKEGLGLGDAKLFAAAGAWLGLVNLPSVLLLASVSALIVTLLMRMITGLDRSIAATPLPFGPYLAVGIWLVSLYGRLTLV